MTAQDLLKINDLLSQVVNIDEQTSKAKLAQISARAFVYKTIINKELRQFKLEINDE